MKVWCIVSMWIPLVPQRFDLKTESSFRPYVKAGATLGAKILKPTPKMHFFPLTISPMYLKSPLTCYQPTYLKLRYRIVFIYS